MEDDDDKTIFQTEEDKEKLKKEILGENLTDDTEAESASNGHLNYRRD